MIKRLLIYIFIYTCLVMPAAAGISLDPSSTLFTARQMGMGGVSVAFSDDANGVFSNPACLAKLEFPQLTGTSRKLVLDQTQYTLLGWAMPTDWGTFGIGYTGMNVGGSLPTMLDPATSRIIIDPTREAMSFDNNVVALSYSRVIQKDLAVGGNLKFFNQSLSGDITSRASATGLGLGILYKPRPWFTAGTNLQNLVEGNLAWEGGSSDRISGVYKLGAKLNILGPTQEALMSHPHKLYGGLDLDMWFSTFSTVYAHLGLEYFPMEKIAIRGGINTDQNGSGLTLGVGLINGGFRFDYAYVSRPGLPGDAPHYFSLSYVGERVVSVSQKLKRKESAIKFIQPQDRFITDQKFIAITAEVKAKRILDQKTTWTVTAISATHEVKEVTAFEDLAPVYINGVKTDQVGTIETSSPLEMGRNVFEFLGYSSAEVIPKKITPEVFTASKEVRVLRFNPFLDTPMEYWAIRPIALSVTLGLVTGYPDNTFKPERGITRAELVTLLVRSMGARLEEEVAYSDFTDVPTTHWAAKYIAYGSFKKLVTGYPDGTFKPSRVLTRAEGVTILARYAQLIEKETATPPFPDLKFGFWANKYITPAKEAGMLKYLGDGDFKPDQPFPRSEACEVLYRTPIIQRRVDQYWETGIVSAQQPTTPATTEAQPTLPVTTEAKVTPPATAEVQPKIQTTPEAQPKPPATLEAKPEPTSTAEAQ